MQCFLGILDIALIRWISLQAKTAFFVGQNLNAKRTLFLGRMEYVACVLTAGIKPKYTTRTNRYTTSTIKGTM